MCTLKKYKNPLLLASLFVFLMITFWGCQSENNKPVFKKQVSALPDTILIKYTWVGFKPYSVVQKFTLRLIPDKNRYQSTGELLQVPVFQNSPRQSMAYNTQISTDEIKSILQTIHQNSWRRCKRPGESINPGESYPNETFLFNTGLKSFKLTSTSNTVTGVPWNLYENDNIYVSTNANLGEVTTDLLQKLRPPEENQDVPNH